MKKWIWLMVFAFMLSGCSAQVYETLGEVAHVSATQPPLRSVSLQLPGDAAVLTSSGGDTMYLCGDYTIALQTFSAGDLDGTVRRISGYSLADLTVMESSCGDHQRYDLVWTAAGEGGDQVCRAAVIDDGNYHYTLTLSGSAASAGQWKQAWNRLMDTFCLAS